MTTTKHYLHPQGISRTIVPTNRPSLSEWLKVYNTPHGSPQWWDAREAEIKKMAADIWKIYKELT